MRSSTTQKMDVNPDTPTEEKGIPLQAAQNSMYLAEKLHPGRTIYHHTVAIELTTHPKQSLKVDLLKKAFNILLNRHNALRSKFVTLDGMIQQTEIPLSELSADAHWPLKIIDAPHIKKVPELNSLVDTLEQLGEKSILNAPFSLEKGPLWRSALIRFSEKKYQLVMNFHHAIFDVTSQNIFLEELSSIYNSLVEKKPLTLPATNDLLNLNLSTEEKSQRMTYWQHKMNGYIPFVLRPDLPPKKFDFHGGRVPFEINADIVKKLKQKIIKSKEAPSLHMTLLASLYVALYRYSGQLDLCIGTASANRRHEQDTSHIINGLVNSVPLRTDLVGDPTFSELTKRVQAVAKEAYQKQIPIDEIAESLPFDIIFVLNNAKKSLNLKHIDATSPIELNLENTKFKYCGINLDEDEKTGKLHGFIEYNKDEFSSSYFEKFIQRWQTLLNGIVDNPEERISDLPFLTEKDKDFLDTHTPPREQPEFKTYFHEVVSQHAEKHPDKDAIIVHYPTGKKEKITFSELDHITNNLAAFLNAVDINPDTPVGICVARSVNLYIALFSVYKSGGVAVPLETAAGEALNYKIQSTQARVVFVDDETEHLFSNYKSHFLTINLNKKEQIMKLGRQLNHSYHSPNLHSDNLAYTRFTSGTTSEPKGVMITHGGAAELANNLRKRNNNKNYSGQYFSFVPVGFDAFEFDWMNAWNKKNPGTLHMLANYSQDGLKQVVQQEHITDLTLPPGIIGPYTPSDFPSVRNVILMGAAPDEKIFKLWNSKKVTIENGYGPTEATVATHIKPYQETDNAPITSIGFPFNNMTMSIVNPADGKNICPPGIPGEMIIEGQLARGYLDENLTRKKFPDLLFDPHHHRFEQPSAYGKVKKSSKESMHRSAPYEKMPTRIYKTGDYGFLTPTGVVFLGRIDRSQIKFRGVRLEIDGVTATLKKHPKVHDGMVIASENNEFLYAYVVPKNSEEKISCREINQFFRQSTLPQVARISQIVHLAKLPLNANGKIDTKALPAPDKNNEEKFTPPATELQKKLKHLWLHVLKIKDIGIDTTFADAGGSSILFGRLEALINERLSLKSPISIAIFSLEDVTIEQMAKKLTAKIKPETLTSNASFFSTTPSSIPTDPLFRLSPFITPTS